MLTKDVMENKEMKVEVQERLKYDNDIFFKFALGTEDEDCLLYTSVKFPAV